jgi:DNA-binding MarR family transcriptional regulator
MSRRTPESGAARPARRAQLEERLAARKRASLAQLLFRAARLYNERAIAQLQERVPAARLAHTQLFPHIDLDGTRQTEVARRAGISKQAVGQLVDELVALGMLRREPDPQDRRAQLVRFTEQGLAGLIAGFDVLDGLESALTERLGKATIERLRRDLAALLAAIEAMSHLAR